MAANYCCIYQSSSVWLYYYSAVTTYTVKLNNNIDLFGRGSVQ